VVLALNALIAVVRRRRVGREDPQLLLEGAPS
jgi:hypothetical protein